MGLSGIIKNIFPRRKGQVEKSSLPGSTELEKVLEKVGPSLGIGKLKKKGGIFSKNK